MAAARASVGFGPQGVAMEEGRAVTLSQGHRRQLQPRDAGGAKSIAVEGGIVSGLGKRRHDIDEGTERPTHPAQHAAGKSFRRKAAARGFQQRQTSLHRKGEGAAARFHPLDALGCGRAGLEDLSH